MVGGRGQALFGAIEAAFIDFRDAVRDLEHRGAAGHELLVEKCIAKAVFLRRRPLKRRLQDLPPRVDFHSQSLKRVLLLRVERAGISVQSRPCLALDRNNIRVLSFTPARAWRKQEIAHVGAGKVDLGTNLLQRAESSEERLADARFIGTDAIELDNRADRGGENEQNQTAETDGQYQHGPQLARPGVHLCRVSFQWSPNASVEEPRRAQNPVLTG